jgi:hypothetical protein
MPTGDEKRVTHLEGRFRLRAYADPSWDGFSIRIDTRRDQVDGTRAVVEETLHPSTASR